MSFSPIDRAPIAEQWTRDGIQPPAELADRVERLKSPFVAQLDSLPVWLRCVSPRVPQ